LNFFDLEYFIFNFKEVAFASGQILYQYYKATSHIDEHSHILAKKLLHLRSHYDYLRIVSHSLGSRMLMKALKELPIEKRPDEIHFCASAITEDGCEDVLLTGPAQVKSYIYHSEE
jgi:esterase/lipase superfamily enzyme